MLEEKQMFIRIRKTGLRTNTEFSCDGKMFYTPETFFDMKAKDFEINIDTGVIKRCGRADTFYIHTGSEKAENG